MRELTVNTFKPAKITTFHLESHLMFSSKEINKKRMKKKHDTRVISVTV